MVTVVLNHFMPISLIVQILHNKSENRRESVWTNISENKELSNQYLTTHYQSAHVEISGHWHLGHSPDRGCRYSTLIQRAQLPPHRSRRRHGAPSSHRCQASSLLSSPCRRRSGCVEVQAGEEGGGTALRVRVARAVGWAADAFPSPTCWRLLWGSDDRICRPHGQIRCSTCGSAVEFGGALVLAVMWAIGAFPSPARWRLLQGSERSATHMGGSVVSPRGSTEQARGAPVLGLHGCGCQRDPGLGSADPRVLSTGSIIPTPGASKVGGQAGRPAVGAPGTVVFSSAQIRCPWRLDPVRPCWGRHLQWRSWQWQRVRHGRRRRCPGSQIRCPQSLGQHPCW